jgi:hypothetical protein
MLLAEIKTKHEEYELKINGISYSLLAPGELSLRDHYVLADAAIRMQQLQAVITQKIPEDEAGKEAAETQIKTALSEIGEYQKRCSDAILARVPAEVRASLTETNITTIIEAYRSAMLRSRLPKEGEGSESPFREGGSEP